MSIKRFNPTCAAVRVWYMMSPVGTRGLTWALGRVLKLLPHWYERRLRLIETDCGRDSGWYVERDGVRLALLSDCRSEEMFWDSYQLEPLTDDEALNRSLLSDFWEGAEWHNVYFRNREFPELTVSGAFPSGMPFQKPGRLMIRGLYWCPLPRMPWDFLFLWLRRRSA